MLRPIFWSSLSVILTLETGAQTESCLEYNLICFQGLPFTCTSKGFLNFEIKDLEIEPIKVKLYSETRKLSED